MPETKEEVDLGEIVNQQAAKIAELEKELASYRHSAKYHKGGDESLYWRNAYLEGKLRRQTAAIHNMQKVGWQPSRIIKEVPYPDDVWEVEQPEAQRREKRRPSILISEA